MFCVFTSDYSCFTVIYVSLIFKIRSFTGLTRQTKDFTGQIAFMSSTCHNNKTSLIWFTTHCLIFDALWVGIKTTVWQWLARGTRVWWWIVFISSDWILVITKSRPWWQQKLVVLVNYVSFSEPIWGKCFFVK